MGANSQTGRLEKGALVIFATELSEIERA